MPRGKLGDKKFKTYGFSVTNPKLQKKLDDIKSSGANFSKSIEEILERALL